MDSRTGTLLRALVRLVRDKTEGWAELGYGVREWLLAEHWRTGLQRFSWPWS